VTEGLGHNPSSSAELGYVPRLGVPRRDPAVELAGVSVFRRGHAVLRDVTLRVERGGFCGVIGPNGAGKTTLLTLLNGFSAAGSGTVRVLGETGPRGFSRLRARIGYVAQQEHVDPRAPVSCFEAVLMGRFGRAGLLRPISAEDRAKAGAMMELTRTAHLRDRPVGRVSGGEARKVALARALAQEPELLLLDEPTSNLDPRAVRELVGLVVEAWRRFGLTVVLVTHQLGHLPEECSRVVMMKRGQVAFSGPCAEGLTAERVEGLFADAG
jgi:ABC-type Mn2+/Zn2+ transport system ATPase subunit